MLVFANLRKSTIECRTFLRVITHIIPDRLAKNMVMRSPTCFQAVTERSG